jgi:hypothetical protein
MGGGLWVTCFFSYCSLKNSCTTTPRSLPLGHEPYLLDIAGQMWGCVTAILGDAAAEIVCGFSQAHRTTLARRATHM